MDTKPACDTQLHVYKATTVRKPKFLKDAICKSDKNKETKTMHAYMQMT